MNRKRSLDTFLDRIDGDSTVAATIHGPAARLLDPIALEECEREYKRQRVDLRPICLKPHEYLELDHCFDPNYDLVNLGSWEQPPPMLSTLWRVYYKMLSSVRDLHLAPDVNRCETGEPIPTEHPRWYLPSGDIIFKVQNILFRLDAQLVSKHLCALGERIKNATTENDSYIDGVPVLECDETEVRDWGLMCRLIYWPVSFFSRDIILFEDICRLLRLSRTFKCMRFRDCAIAALTQLFPVTLDHHLRKVRNNGVRALPPAYVIHTINLCLDHGIPHILVMAMFQLAEYRPRYIINGIEDEPGVVVQISDSRIPIRVLQARQKLATARRDITLGFLKDVPSLDLETYRFSDRCDGQRIPVPDLDPCDTITCSAFLRALLVSWHMHQNDEWHGGKTERMAGAFAILRADALGPSHWTHRLCRSCARKLRIEMKKGQRKLWMTLPEMFGLPSWFDLQTFNHAIVDALQVDYTNRNQKCRSDCGISNTSSSSSGIETV